MRFQSTLLFLSFVAFASADAETPLDVVPDAEIPLDISPVINTDTGTSPLPLDWTSGSKTITFITEANYVETMARADTSWIVLFYAPWCGKCKQIKGRFQDASESTAEHECEAVSVFTCDELTPLPGDVKYAQVDCVEQPELCGVFRISSYPQIRFILPNGTVSHPLHGTASKNNLLFGHLYWFTHQGLLPKLPYLPSSPLEKELLFILTDVIAMWEANQQVVLALSIFGLFLGLIFGGLITSGAGVMLLFLPLAGTAGLLYTQEEAFLVAWGTQRNAIGVLCAGSFLVGLVLGRTGCCMGDEDKEKAE